MKTLHVSGHTTVLSEYPIFRPIEFRGFLNNGYLKSCLFIAGFCLLACQISIAQTGIGTTLPLAALHLNEGSALGTGEIADPTLVPWYNPASPEIYYSRMHWIHDKSAFRAVGGVLGNNGFNPQQVGIFSFASGYEAVASGIVSTALGATSIASGNYSFAGASATASGSTSFAYGYQCFASGNNSVTIGSYATTNGREGSFAYGDNVSGAISKNDANHQIIMRFSGGYKFFSDTPSSVGVRLVPSGNSWTIWSDVTKKEKFSPVNGERLLEKISSFQLTSWNYTGQEAQLFRHYGPMAQDFYQAFGKDNVGVIGTDTTINQADFDGVNLIAIQTLVKRTEDLQRMNSDLLAEIATIKAQLAEAQFAPVRKRKRILVSQR
ncbi:hypothetical protein SAMN05216327_108232 [Dyadobacter sp. SG02]|uniref:tail fiber domain-containing protein n=1 Tax=Dyadobacter sp. SG02 TaxID=1855291 RepID=UPI0008B7AED0|nr:tail fiber domain-containing protein [Dyadobacter sp. SG02]SEJ31637.1 hypothetical protein SAMN05216327_108232 [Dyadobacter sp. SG02]